MKFLHNGIGLYIHIPFCVRKCAYCNFYSSFAAGEAIADYLSALEKEIERWGGIINRPIDSVYIGGGTPSLLGEKISLLLKCIKENFNVVSDAEVTVEMNPSGNVVPFLTAAKSGGVNRLSIGVQSASDKELELLGRTHTADMAKSAVCEARKLGFSNISLDIMSGLPESSVLSLKSSADFIISLKPEHISAYILKVEPKTLFAAKKDLRFPDDDEQAEQYMYLCDRFEQAGYNHYEISNFSKENHESRHNLKYWNDCEYLGIGPSAHSFLDGKRFYYPENLKKFINSPETVFEDTGGDIKEKLILALRLKKGINIAEFFKNGSPKLNQLLQKLSDVGYAEYSFPNFSLTDKGMLVSNIIIEELTELIYENI